MTKEAKAYYRYLTKENKRLIQRIEIYLSTQYINDICYNELMSDIIGMAYESQQRDENFSETVGNIGSFCQEISANTPKQSIAERLLGLCAWAMICLGMLVPILWGYSLIFKNPFFFPSNIFTFSVPVSFVAKYMIIVFMFSLGSRYIKFGTKVTHTIFMSIYSVFFIILLVFSDNFLPELLGDRVIKMNVFVWIFTFAIFTALFILAKNITVLRNAYKRNKK